MNDYANYLNYTLSQSEKEEIYSHLMDIHAHKDKIPPLHVMLVTKAYLLNPQSFKQWGYDDILMHIIDRYRTEWKNFFSDSSFTESFEKLILLATSTKILDIRNPFENSFEKHRIQICSFINSYGKLPNHSKDNITKLEPDIIGEFFVLYLLSRIVDIKELDEMCLAFWREPNEFKEFVNRCILDYICMDTDNWNEILVNPQWLIPSEIDNAHIDPIKEIFKQLCITLSAEQYKHIETAFEHLCKASLKETLSSLKQDMSISDEKTLFRKDVLYFFALDLGRFCRNYSLFELTIFWLNKASHFTYKEIQEVTVQKEIGLTFTVQSEFVRAAHVFNSCLIKFSDYLEENDLENLNLNSELLFAYTRMHSRDLSQTLDEVDLIRIRNKVNDLLMKLEVINPDSQTRQDISNAFYILGVHWYNVYSKEGKKTEALFMAETFNQKALDHLHEEDNNFYERKSFSLNLNGFICREQSKYKEAIEAFEKNLALKKQVYVGKHNTYVATAEMNLGRILTYNVDGREAEAEILLKSSLEAFEIIIPESDNIVRIKDALNALMKKQNN